jgi:Flp pilus assembly pilin Flp
MVRSLGSIRFQRSFPMSRSDARSATRKVRLDLLERFVVEENGQDLIEYAFLAAALATAGMLALNAIGPAVGVTYGTWLSPTTGAPALWEPSAPWTTAGS